MSALYAIRRTADIEIDFVVAVALADPCGFREINRIRSAELQRNGMLAGIETQQPLAISVNDRGRGQHLSIKTCAARQQAMEHAAMPVGPVHHGGDGKAPIA